MTSQSGGDRLPWWDPVGAWQQVGEAFTEPIVEPALPNWGSRNALQALVDGLRAGLVGRPVVVGKGPKRVAFTLSTLEATVGHLAAAAGQADDVTVTAEDVEFRSYKLESVRASLHNVHTRLRARSVLVAAPIDVSLKLAGDQVSEFLAGLAPSVTFEITDAGRVFVRRTRSPLWGHVEVRPSVEKGGLVVRPIGVGRGARQWLFRRRMVPVRPKVTLPDGWRITGVEVHPGCLVAHLRVDEWRLDYQMLAALVRKRAGGGQAS
jgi:hypothetical protein